MNVPPRPAPDGRPAPDEPNGPERTSNTPALPAPDPALVVGDEEAIRTPARAAVAARAGLFGAEVDDDQAAGQGRAGRGCKANGERPTPETGAALRAG